MAAGGVGNGFAAEHTGDFFDAACAVKHADSADGLAAVAVFVHLPVVFAARGDLRQVGNGQYLMLPAQCPQRFTDGFGHAAADAGVDFVEYQRRNAGVAAGYDLQGEADTCQFAAGCDFVERAQRAAAVGGNLILHLLQTVCGRGRGQQLDMELCAFHGQMLHMAGGFVAQPCGGFAAHGGECLCGFVVLGFAAGDGGFEGGDVAGGVEVLQVEADFFQFGGQVLRFDAVFSCRAHQFAHALFLFGQFVGVDVGPRGDIAHVGADFAEFGFDAGEHVEAFGKAWFDGLQAAEEFLAAVYLPLYAVVAVYGFAGFCGGLQQFGGMGEAVVALVEGFPFALLKAELVEFVELPFQPFTLDGGVFGLIPCFVQGFFGVFPILVALSDGFRLFQTAGEGVEQAALGGFLIEGVVRSGRGCR